MRASRILAPIAAAVLAGCASFPPDRIGHCGRIPLIERSGTEESTTVSVLTYNVEGLPWPARAGRGPRLKRIADELAAMRAASTAPDLVLLQEAFTPSAASIGAIGGYANYVRGPSARMPRPPSSVEAEPQLVNRRKRRKGEGFAPLIGSGLYILSDYPIIAVRRQPFRSRECAGFDCLANKGIMHARIELPGVPQPIELFNVHLNSRAASGVSRSRSLLAHRLQVNEASRFIEAVRDPALPLIFGGDFNMRNSPSRFERFQLRKPWPIVHQWCHNNPACEVRTSWDGDAPWMDTQDLQGFDTGRLVNLRPVKVEAMFDRPWRGRPLADHEGLLTVYRLSWPAHTAASALASASLAARRGAQFGERKRVTD